MDRKTDEKFMRLAMVEARKGEFQTWPNPWVGAVLVKAGKVVARGWHRGAGLPHAEAEALRLAGRKAKGSTLYVTLEPCAHYGRTPPCASAIVEAGVKRVVVACPDPNPKAHGGLAYLRKHKVELGPYTLQREAEELNRYFFFAMRNQRPFFTLKAAASLDGRTATSSGESKWITGPEARADARALRNRCDAVLVGAGTVAQDQPTLMPDSRDGYLPWRLVLDPRGQLSGDESVFRDAFAPRTVWFAGLGSFKHALEAARKGGAQVQALHAGGLSGAVKSALEWMSAHELRRVMVEGGAATLGAFLRLGLADELVLYLAPRLEGSGLGRPIFISPDERHLQDWPGLSLESVTLIGQDLRLHGSFLRPTEGKP
jgi:diaminohydroxyphosphoribosylaminopyrimidine deaminase/5-amino-6-(5-phosphoribosylamino)uracil reductase